MNYTIKAIIVIAAVLAIVAVISLSIVIVLATDLELIPMPTTTIDRQLFTIEEQEDNSIEVYDRSNGTQIAGFDNVGEMLQGMPQVIQNMIKYYANKNLTDIAVVR